MSTKSEIVPIVIFSAIGVGLMAVLGKRLKSSGGLAKEAAEAIIGTPTSARIDNVTAVVPRFEPDTDGAIDGGVVSGIVSPRDGGVISRNAYLGNEFSVRLRLENVTAQEKNPEIVVELIEDDIVASKPIPHHLGRIAIPPHSALECDATLFVKTQVFVTWHLTVTAIVKCDGVSFGSTTFDIG